MNGSSTDALSTVSETLLIPLPARIIAPNRHPDHRFREDEAIRIGAALGFDPERFARDTGSMRGAVLRATWFDRIPHAFLGRHPNGPCLSIGSGLDDRPARIGLPATADWIDVEVADIARRAGPLSWLAATLHRALTGRPVYFCGHCRYGPTDFR